ncbi:eukaryotic aspartyl protease family protein [Striga asiatica]|uniref:Eukaryotic aspartyl protease family protein n=1 Tax=Striga asiatica TaxID=4170 RepID=A0A5A7Q3F7_STRAF|nr:eukaryotic aspartyl protease family protein [Striga asiatica]
MTGHHRLPESQLTNHRTNGKNSKNKINKESQPSDRTSSTFMAEGQAAPQSAATRGTPSTTIGEPSNIMSLPTAPENTQVKICSNSKSGQAHIGDGTRIGVTSLPTAPENTLVKSCSIPKSAVGDHLDKDAQILNQSHVTTKGPRSIFLPNPLIMRAAPDKAQPFNNGPNPTPFLHPNPQSHFRPKLHTSRSSMKNRHSSLVVLELVNRHGPCAPYEQQLMNPRKPTTHDVARTSLSPPDSTGEFQYYSHHIVTMGFGTPQKKLSLVLETSYDLTWIQCKPCPHKMCHRQNGPLFDPSKSTSYSPIPCSSTQCSIVDFYTTSGPTCSKTGNCVYHLKDYVSNNISGDFSKDTLTIAPNIAFAAFKFGCTHSAQGTFGLEDGVLGLGRSNTSIVVQTANTFHQCFSYCIPAKSSSKGFLALGKDYDCTTKFTPLIYISDYPYNYFITIIAIAVDGRKLDLKPKDFGGPGNTFIDSSTTITQLPYYAYKVLARTFNYFMLNDYGYFNAYPPYDGLGLEYCFVPHGKNVVPIVSFTFQNDVKIDLDFSGTIIYYNKSLMCLAFIDNDNFPTFGITQQRTFEVVYDVGRNKLGFRQNMC